MVDMSKSPPEGRYVRAGPINMHLLEFGKGPNVVFLHGSGPGNSAWANFRGNYEAFVEAGYKAILPDMIGFGYSDKPTDLGDYTLDLFCDTLVEGLKAAGINKASFVGNSLGGGVGVLLALKHPEMVEKLILMGPGCIEEQPEYFKMPGIAKMMAAAGAGINEENLQEVLQSFVYDKSIIGDDLVEMRWAVAQTQPAEVLTTMKTPNLGPRLKELRCPILTFWGHNDEFMPPSGKQLCVEANETSRLIEINACGHWVMIEHARLFNAASIDFLQNG